MTGLRPSVTTFVQARNYRPAHGARRVRLVVLHSAEAPERPGTAQAIARWFAGPEAPMASAHYAVDAGTTVQCVLEGDVAFAAPGANHDGIQIELAGYARQEREDWLDTYSAAMLERAAVLVGFICADYRIPAEIVDAAGLLAGRSGITTHAAVTAAYGLSTHTDPGPGFPMAAFVGLVSERMPQEAGQ